MKMLHSAKDIANWFLAWNEEDRVIKIDSTKLQKLTYLAKGYSSPYLGYEIFASNAEAFEKGPVFTSLYTLYKNSNRNDVRLNTKFDFNDFSSEENRFLFSIWEKYAYEKTQDLVDAVHEHSIWSLVFHQEESKPKIIKNEDINNFFLEGLYKPIEL